MVRLRTGFDRPKGKDLSYLSHILKFVRPYWPQVIGATIALIFTAIGILGLGHGLRDLIDNGFSNGNMKAINHALFLLFCLSIIMAVGIFFRFYLMSWLGERVVADLRKSVFDKILSLHIGFFESAKTGEILSRLTTDTTLLQTVIGSSASIALRNLFNLVGGIIMLLVTNPKLTGLVFLLVPIVVLPIIFFGRKVRKLSRKSQDRVADISAFAEETINSVRTVQAFTHENEDVQRFAAEVNKAFQVSISRIKMRSFLTSSVILLVFGAIGIILWVGGQSMLMGQITGGELAAFVYYAAIVAFSVGVISEVYGELLRAAGATERLIELLQIVPEIIVKTPLKNLPSPALGAVNFDNITFHYPSRPNIAALINFSANINPGETVALVGQSGSGKSTVFQLMLRFYEPDAGCISIDGVNLQSAEIKSVRERCGFVSQDPVIFGNNVWENIRYGRPQATNEEVEIAAKNAAADNFISELPQQYETFLGEKGVRLSGGQRQRISLARAILHNPAILLLDEATSALDAENEHLVKIGLEKLKKGRTTLVIAHRLSTVINADRILVIDKGTVVASGTHKHLMQNNSLYLRLANLQFKDKV